MENEPLIQHSYDGIQEFDNPLPSWWKWMFVGSIVYSMLYALFFHIGAPGRSIVDQYDAALAANTRLQFSEVGDLQPTADNILLYSSALVGSRKSWLSVGQTLYKTNCVSCHGRDGEGKVGPNLADDYYKNVHKVEDIARVISQGAGNGAMPAWGTRLLPNEIILVSAYVASLRGSPKGEGGKPPEGSEIPPWPEPSATAGTATPESTTTEKETDTGQAEEAKEG